MNGDAVLFNGSCPGRQAADPSNVKSTRYWMDKGIPVVLAVGADNSPEFASSRGGPEQLASLLASLFAQHGDSAPHRPDHMFLFVDRPPRYVDTIFA